MSTRATTSDLLDSKHGHRWRAGAKSVGNPFVAYWVEPIGCNQAAKEDKVKDRAGRAGQASGLTTIHCDGVMQQRGTEDSKELMRERQKPKRR